jgi:hypothetical protein
MARGRNTGHDQPNFALAEPSGLTMAALARELTFPLPPLRLLLSDAEPETRPLRSV